MGAGSLARGVTEIAETRPLPGAAPPVGLSEAEAARRLEQRGPLEPPATSRSLASIVRAADLIGQLSDPRYLKKIPALFFEFQETGMSRTLGYQNPADLRENYPKFYWENVFPYVKEALGYLSLTQAGQQIKASLYANVFVVEHEAPGAATRAEN